MRLTCVSINVFDLICGMQLPTPHILTKINLTMQHSSFVRYVYETYQPQTSIHTCCMGMFGQQHMLYTVDMCVTACNEETEWENDEMNKSEDTSDWKNWVNSSLALSRTTHTHTAHKALDAPSELKYFFLFSRRNRIDDLIRFILKNFKRGPRSSFVWLLSPSHRIRCIVLSMPLWLVYSDSTWLDQFLDFSNWRAARRRWWRWWRWRRRWRRIKSINLHMNAMGATEI